MHITLTALPNIKQEINYFLKAGTHNKNIPECRVFGKI